MDMASQIPAELESTLQLKTLRYLSTKRPWLDLYGVNVRPVAPLGSVSRRPNIDQSLLHRVLPDELLFEVFIRITPHDMGRAACVCRKWKYTLRNPTFWRNACLKAWQIFGIVENYRVLQFDYGSSWRKMWLFRPRVRTDGTRFVKIPTFSQSPLSGLYVSRNTYIRTGVMEWSVINPVHLVCYYRYLRFYSSGRFLYKNSSQVVKEVAKCMNTRASKGDCVYGGHYTLKEDRAEAAFVYPGLRPTLWRICLRLRGTVAGANNRMDLVSLITSGVNEEDWGGENEVNPCFHNRGMRPFTFVPFEEVENSVLNLPVEKMDYFVPG